MTSQAFLLHAIFMLDFPGGVSGKESDCQCGRCKRCGFNPWIRKIPREGNGNPLQYSPLGKPMDRGGWWATVHGVTKSWTRLSRHTHTFVLYNLCPLTYETSVIWREWELSVTTELAISLKHSVYSQGPDHQWRELRWISLHWCHGSLTVTHRRHDSDLVMEHPCRKFALSSQIVSWEGKMSSFSAQF